VASRSGAARPFFLTYLLRELRQRARQAAIIALGLALGVGLVVTVTAASTGIGQAQGDILHALYGIGTDLTVTRAGPAAARASALGSSPRRSDLMPVDGLGALDPSVVDTVARLPGVARAAGGLRLTDLMPTAGLPEPVGVDGVDPARPGLGPFAAATLTAGRTFTGTDSNAAVIDSRYAAAHGLAVGSTITIAGRSVPVIGVSRPTQASGAPAIYLPLRQAQALSAAAEVNVIYVAATSATDVSAVRAWISRRYPTLTVTNAGNLAATVTGSLGSAAGLANDLGRWVAVAVLLAAFAVAGLLTMAAVAHRVREFGTLKALGWRGRRIVAQIMGESAVTGVLGAPLGIAFGFAGAGLVDAVAPTLSATVPGDTAAVPVHLTAPVSAAAILLAVLLALAGALAAGSLGAWRAARLRPAHAFARID
jgi:putative ABC transport system permease protein